MKIQKNQKLLLVITIILVIVAFLSTFIIAGCGRRARTIAALKEAGQSEKQNSQSQTETVKESGETDTGETVEGSKEDEVTTEAEESTSVEESTENEDSDTSESEEGTEDEETTETEEIIEDEETTASESAEETTTEERTEYTADMPYVAAECANIIGDEVEYDFTRIYPGDYGPINAETRGFISYDISQLSGATIESAKISGQAGTLQGTPVATYGPLIIKAVYWGARAVEVADYDLDGIEITNISKTNFGKSPAILKEDLQKAADNGSNRYQLCFYFEMPQTDGDGEYDCIGYLLEDITITVTYSK